MATIRIAEDKDLEQISRIAVKCFPHDFVKGSTDNPEANALEWITENHGRKKFAGYHVAEQNGEVIGYIFHAMDGGSSPGIVKLEQIGVDPKYQRTGVGKELINESENFWRDYLEDQFCVPMYKMILTTSEVNAAAHKFYENCGFKPEGNIPKLFRNKDEQIWVKEFK